MNIWKADVLSALLWRNTKFCVLLNSVLLNCVLLNSAENSTCENKTKLYQSNEYNGQREWLLKLRNKNSFLKWAWHHFYQVDRNDFKHWCCSIFKSIDFKMYSMSQNNWCFLFTAFNPEASADRKIILSWMVSHFFPPQSFKYFFKTLLDK